MHRSGISDKCNIVWDMPPTVSCNPMQINVSLILQNGTQVYSDNFGLDITSTKVTPMNLDAVYTAAVTAQNECGSTTCLMSCSAGKDRAGWLLQYVLILVCLSSMLKYEPLYMINRNGRIFHCVHVY